MRLELAVLVAVAALSSNASAQADEQEVRAAASAIVSAFGSHDTGRYFALFAPEATFVFHSSPTRLNSVDEYRREWAKWEKETGFRVRSCSSTNQRVQVFGEVAVFSHDVRTDLSTNDGETTLHERETIIFHKRGGKWVAVHEHLSPQPEPHDNTGP